MFHKSIPFGVNELSGTFGIDWVIWNVGGINYSPASNTKYFSWHYHPIDEPCFSYRDWFTFLRIESPLTLLITNTKINIHIKEELGAWINIKRLTNKISAKQGNQETLTYIKLCKLFDSQIIPETINSRSDYGICKIIGIKFIEVDISE